MLFNKSYLILYVTVVRSFDTPKQGFDVKTVSPPGDLGVQQKICEQRRLVKQQLSADMLH